MTVSKEVTIKLHLYTDDPSRFSIPGTTEWGEDVEFNGNDRSRLINAITHSIFGKYSDFKYAGELCTSGILLTRLIFEHNEFDVNFIINILTDQNAWPQIDPHRSADRRKLVENGELGQSWWLHHITLPNGDTLDSNDRITKEIETKCVNAVVAEIDRFLEEQNLK